MIHYRSDDHYEKLNKVKEILEEYKPQGRYKDTLKELSMSSTKNKKYRNSGNLEEAFAEYLIKHDLLDIEALDKAIEDFTESLKNKTYTQINYSSISSFINPYYLIKKGLLTFEKLNEEITNYSFESEKDIIDYYGEINSFETDLIKIINNNTIIYKFKVSKITQKYVEIERDSCLFANYNRYDIDFSSVYYSKFKIPKDLFSEFYELSLNEPVLIELGKNESGKYAYFIDFETFEKLEPLFQKYLKIYNYKEDFDYEDDEENQNKISKYFLYKMSTKYLQSIHEVKNNLEKDIETLVSKYNNLDYPSLEDMLKNRYSIERLLKVEEREEIVDKIAELKHKLSSINEYSDLASKAVQEFENLILPTEEKIVSRYIIDLFLIDKHIEYDIFRSITRPSENIGYSYNFLEFLREVEVESNDFEDLYL